jgi:hypothetical protein
LIIQGAGDVEVMVTDNGVWVHRVGSKKSECVFRLTQINGGILLSDYRSVKVEEEDRAAWQARMSDPERQARMDRCDPRGLCESTRREMAEEAAE